jgi:hypothetical protein
VDPHFEQLGYFCDLLVFGFGTGQLVLELADERVQAFQSCTVQLLLGLVEVLVVFRTLRRILRLVFF